MSNLISKDYQRLNYELHKDSPEYGTHAADSVQAIAAIARACGARRILDYGCGKGLLKPALKKVLPHIIVDEYDPAIPGKRELPKTPADMVVCLDVMEHIEPVFLDDVLASIRRLTIKWAFLSIATIPAQKTLADGRNAHLIVETEDWWLQKLANHFRNPVTQPHEGGFAYMAQPLP